MMLHRGWALINFPASTAPHLDPPPRGRGGERNEAFLVFFLLSHALFQIVDILSTVLEAGVGHDALL